MDASFASLLGAPSGLAGLTTTDPMAFRKPSVTAAATPDDALKVGRQFETMFLSEMLQPMFQGLKTDGLFGGGHGEEMFRSMQVEEYAKAVMKQGGIGVAAAVQREVLRMQEQAHVPAPAAH